jgi:YgiT-type zinc finger domain-containing protein
MSAPLLCVICKTGELRRGVTTDATQVGTVTIIVKGIPAEVCTQCGEAYYDGPTVDRLHALQRDAIRRGVTLEMIDYEAVAA